MIDALTENEKRVLLEMAGLRHTINDWGGWITAAVGALTGFGLVVRNYTGDKIRYEITPRGLEVAQEIFDGIASEAPLN